MQPYSPRFDQHTQLRRSQMSNAICGTVVGKPSILCVEPDPTDNIAIQDYAWILGWDLSLCWTTVECLELVKKRRFDLVICGADPLQKDGSDLISEIRSGEGKNPNVAILLLSNQRTLLKRNSDKTDHESIYFCKRPLMLSDLLSVLRNTPDLK
ncbi:MAG: hypothetical protein ACFB03_19735 [Paracoccaceae bacterium]